MPEANIISGHMEVIDVNGAHVGTVDHVEGDRIKLTESAYNGADRYVPTALVQDFVENTVMLTKSTADALSVGAASA